MPTTQQIMADLDSHVLAAYWSTMESILSADDTKSARVNAIVLLNKQMDEAVAKVHELQEKFSSDHLHGYYTDSDFLSTPIPPYFPKAI